MLKYLLSGLVGIILLVIAACGGDDATAVPAAAATAVPAVAATTAPAAVAATTAPASGQAPAANTLASIAAKFANGPGAIFVGDINQLVGPAPNEKQGDFDGNVPLDALQRHLWIYESDYYRGLLEKARYLNPTELVSSGESITVQHACINRALLPCQLIDSFFAPNLTERTNGQLEIQVSSFPELGLAGPDTLSLVSDGTLAMANIYGGYVGGELPPIEIQVLWGIYPDRETEFVATALITPDLEKLVTEATNGGVLVNHNWFSGNDQFFFSKDPLRTVDDFKGLKTRSHSAALSDWIEGMGASAQFVAFSEVYTALERGILEAGVTGGDAGFGQRWYEVTKYINGPLVSFPSTNNVINSKVWANIPPDLQQILLEEGAKSELEALRIASIQNEMGLLKNTDAGLEFVPFSPELQELSRQTTMGNVIPGWLRRLGGADKPIIKIFNDKVGPIVGLFINPNGTVIQTDVVSVAARVALEAFASTQAGGPGAIYVGDINQLVGPAPTDAQGDFDGQVPLDALQRHLYIYESSYYDGLLLKARLTNPTVVTTTGTSLEIQHVCINRALLPCQIIDSYYGPNVEARTNGQVKIQISSFPELGIAGPDTLSLVADGTLAMANVYSGYVAGELPSIEIQSLWGMFATQQQQYQAVVDITAELEAMVIAETDGSIILNHNWFAGIDQFFFCNEALTSLEDFKGVKTRSHSAAISDWIEGMGASAQFVAFSEVYTALERGILDCGVTGADPAFGQRWYEVTKYMNGPLVSFFNTNNVINKDVWAKLAPDLQQVLIEEGAKTELEALRLAAIQNEVGVEKNVREGLEIVAFSEELQDHSYNVAVLQFVIPGWLRRVGDRDPYKVVDLFNLKVGPIVGLRIEDDGSITKVGKTKR